MNVAANDVDMMHRCLSTAMFKRLGKAIRAGWEREGETTLARIFFQSYFDSEPFNNWRINSFGLAGCLPCNNALERVNQELKGTKATRGLIKPGQPMYSALTLER